MNRDVGLVHVGLPVAVKLEAFPFTRCGTLTGTVSSLSSDAIEDDKFWLVYPARVKLARAERGRSEAITAAVGMEVTADVRTGQRTILSYLFTPIAEVTQEAGREP